MNRPLSSDDDDPFQPDPSENLMQRAQKAEIAMLEAKAEALKEVTVMFAAITRLCDHVVEKDKARP